ncbi:hypothetical protein AYL99_04504 [Fonsecaea erecta]|uniref:Uncharacterized protein n=1 Tax=Fonsecaea erecta TaxID=1367422 RepID=A0A178ZS83_9EURO|nr:hypothetical protein AYL99_04504 [Fonsecaea erecta]OAP62301.1 hypothetical protein AYL99_04504 [Fonsecaea erecta]
MSSEQRYDISYEQMLLQDELPDLDLFPLPGSCLFDSPTITSATADFSYTPLENGQADSQQGEQSFDSPNLAEQDHQFNTIEDITSDFNSDIFATRQPFASSASAPMSPAATWKSLSVLDGGDFRSLRAGSQTLDNAAGHYYLGEMEAAPNALLDPDGLRSTGLATANNEAQLGPNLHVPQIQPID